RSRLRHLSTPDRRRLDRCHVCGGSQPDSCRGSRFDFTGGAGRRSGSHLLCHPLRVGDPRFRDSGCGCGHRTDLRDLVSGAGALGFTRLRSGGVVRRNRLTRDNGRRTLRQRARPAGGTADRRFGSQRARSAHGGGRLGRPGRANRPPRRTTVATRPATLIYTSGTTGRPKGCQLTQSNLVHEIKGARAYHPTLLRKGERLLVFLPLAHVLARAISMAAFHSKVTVGFTSDIKNLLPMLAVFKPTVVVSVPRVFEKVYNTAEQNAANAGKGRIFAIAAQTAVDWSEACDRGGPGLLLRAKHAVFDRLVYRKLRAALGGNCRAAVSGGAPLGARLGHFYRGAGLTIYEGYGLSETSGGVAISQFNDLKIGTVGKPVPGNSLRIADDGELLVRGGVVFSGYWRNEQATTEAFTDGWFKTGDLGAVDEDGFLTITGRKKEIIVTAGGKNVAPAVLEDQLRAHPLISQAVVVGDAKPFIGALITIDPEAFEGWKQRNSKTAGASVGDLATDPDLIAEIDAAVKQANLAVSHAESIRKFRILPVDFTEDTGELTPTMKVKRKVVAEKFASDIEAIYNKE
ncbi:LOW QUALITY PROTEIN: long-chain fatty-acid-CoA ligase fadD15, partial [Mycobacterium tuberculosis variant africanum K85]